MCIRDRANGYAAWAAAHGESPVFRPVNRIDKDTSGLVLAAKNGYAAPLLAEGCLLYTSRLCFGTIAQTVCEYLGVDASSLDGHLSLIHI